MKAITPSQNFFPLEIRLGFYHSLSDILCTHAHTLTYTDKTTPQKNLFKTQVVEAFSPMTLLIKHLLQ